MPESVVVSSRQGMLAGMTPVLKNGTYFFCTTTDGETMIRAREQSLVNMKEDEGYTLVLEGADAARFGFDLSLPMAHIVLKVFSSLEGVGLTAGVSTALAEAEIACNIVAAYHHDHVFVPKAQAAQAIRILLALQEDAAQGITKD